MLRQVATGTRVYLACRPVDMRKGINGLTAHVAVFLDVDPYSGHLFVFRGKKGDQLKLVYWDGSGMCLFVKRFEKGRFVWPPTIDGSQMLTTSQLQILLEGMDWTRTIARPDIVRPMYA